MHGHSIPATDQTHCAGQDIRDTQRDDDRNENGEKLKLVHGCPIRCAWVLDSQEAYSARRATIGSTLVARRAGTTQATNATMVRSSGTTTKVLDRTG